MADLVRVTNNETGESCLTTPEHAAQMQQSGCEITEEQVAKAKASVEEDVAEAKETKKSGGVLGSLLGASKDE
jgi:hypothetical protein